MVLPHHVFNLPLVCGKTLAEQQIWLEKWENADIKESSQMKPNNNSLVIKLSQGFSFSFSFSRVTDNILSQILWAVLKILKPSPGGRSQLHDDWSVAVINAATVLRTGLREMETNWP